jgi:peptidoglycan/xylan/chitin deacetylase (PgdA/CDA1 family)
MRTSTLGGLLVATAVAPMLAYSWGSIDEVRYKMKGADGNLWAQMLGGGRLIQGDEVPGTVTFTFDDGPDHRTTPILLDQLDRYNVKAAFFVNGAKFHPLTAGGMENRAVLRDIYRRGHYIGSHTFSHQDITTLDDESWKAEVDQVKKAISGIIGRRPWIFRPPFGKTDARSRERLLLDGYTIVMWNLDSGDWKAGSPAGLFANVKRLLEENPAGGVFLFHDTNRATVQAFPLIVEWIEEHNATERARGGPTLDIVGLEHYVSNRRR